MKKRIAGILTESTYRNYSNPGESVVNGCTDPRAIGP